MLLTPFGHGSQLRQGLTIELSNHPRGDTHRQRVCRNVTSHYGPRSDDRVVADVDASSDNDL